MGKLKNKLPVLVAEYRIKKGDKLSLVELAQQTGVARETLSRMMSGDVRVSGQTIEKLCNFFRCQPGDLLYMEFGDSPKSA